MVQFSSQIIYIIIITTLSVAFGLDDVVTAQVSQGVNDLWIMIAFYGALRLLPHVPPCHEAHGRLWLACFLQNLSYSATHL
jgi:hypothetical protein